MNKVLVDTSVWINVFKGIETKASGMLKNNSNNFIIATCPVILQEVLQGVVEDQRYSKLSRYFNGLEQLTGNPYQLRMTPRDYTATFGKGALQSESRTTVL